MLTNSSDQYRPNGVSVYSGSDRVRVVYDGLLQKSGAANVYAHVGFGKMWANSHDYKMLRTPSGFEATIPVQRGEILNIAFKDCANNWDNNSGKNYSLGML
jgi:hypothetical protein